VEAAPVSLEDFDPPAMGDFGDIGFEVLPSEPPPSAASEQAPFANMEQAPTMYAQQAVHVQEPEAIPPVDVVAGEDQAVDPVDERGSFSIPVPIKSSTTLLLDVTPRGLGVGTAGGYCDEVIERNAAIPVEQSRLFSTSRDDQTEVAIDVYQGESRRFSENTKLGCVELSGLRPAPRGEIKIRVTFEIDTDGILGVSARNEETGEAQATRIVLTGGMDESQVSELVKKYSS